MNKLSAPRLPVKFPSALCSSLLTNMSSFEAFFGKAVLEPLFPIAAPLSTYLLCLGLFLPQKGLPLPLRNFSFSKLPLMNKTKRFISFLKCSIFLLPQSVNSYVLFTGLKKAVSMLADSGNEREYNTILAILYSHCLK